jgi:rhamnosyltransferase
MMFACIKRLMSRPDFVSIVMRSKNDAALIGATLEAVRQQDFAGKIEMIHVDSGSTDGTVEIIKSFHPDTLIQIKPGEYVPGVVLNRGMREAKSDWVIFLNSDCGPLNNRWLSEMLAVAESSPRAGTIFGRQVPRPGCRAVYAHDYDRCFGDGRESKNWDHFFSMANSAVRRAAWEQHPFREDLQYSEDDEWSRRLVKNGWDVVYAERSVVMHSHNYTLREAFKRCYGEAFALAALDTVAAEHYGIFRTLISGWLREGLRDLRYCSRHGRLAEWPHALAVRAWQRAGKLRGFRDGWARYRKNIHGAHGIAPAGAVFNSVSEQA